ncbi:hypothetical protein BGZ98_008424 [Dissophora globulifera]|uniref:Uncharacterized protein n=1 Tax=Dissophora globulifera TaxID=979702 RepID=A0A9P6UXB0_9FUNG|nr:hypothetical protein BGZ98_008424 [Dissophora globulifera]KAG0323459.1 hypothetical protein BGZ99_002760 [Dissophora globulifera]
MIPTMRTAIPKTLTTARLMSSAAQSNAPATSFASSASRTAAKVAAYAVIGSTTVVAGASVLFKDEVVYWTPNVRK